MNPTTTFPGNSISIVEENARFMAGVYKWMTGGILISALVSTGLTTQPELMAAIVQSPIFYILMIAELILVFSLSAAIRRISAMTAALLFLGYAVLNGVTLSVLFLIYTRESISSVFFLTAFSFAGLSALGYTTKKDLGPIGAFCGMALFGMIGFALVSMFFPSLWTGQTSYVYSAIGVLVFAGLTAYDTQKIKAMNIIGNEGSEEDRKEAIIGALTLYLDFINLFINLLRLTGSRRR